MLLWAGLLIVSAIYLHALDPLPQNASGFRKLWKGVGVIALLVGVALLVGALAGRRDILQPLSGLRSASGAAAARRHRHLQCSKRVRSIAELEQASRRPPEEPCMLDFYADWCVSCKEMERFTFTDPAGARAHGPHAPATGRRHRQRGRDAALLKRFNLFGPPGILFFGRAG